MNTEIHWGRVGVVLVAVAGIAGIFFVMGQKSKEQVLLPVPQTVVKTDTKVPEAKLVESKVAETKQAPLIDEKIYRNEQYGFSVTFPSKAKIATECPVDSYKAYNQIKEYIFADKQIRCASEGYYASDPSGGYDAQGAQFSATVYDLKKCQDSITDQSEKEFCAKYGKTTATKGEALSSWPLGMWVKKDNYVIFFNDFGFEKDSSWKSYQFSAF